MFIPTSCLIYSEFGELLANARRAGISPSPDKPEQIGPDAGLSERLLYTQSNGRVLLGHDPSGRLHFLCAPHEKDFALPTMRGAKDYVVNAAPGMVRQAMIAMFLGQLYFSVELGDGRTLTSGDEGSTTFYADGFLPVTLCEREGLTLCSASVAPVWEPDTESALHPLPLPGPSGAAHLLYLENTGGRPLTARVKLSFSQRFLSHYHETRQSVERQAKRPYQAEWDDNLLMLWRPDACAAIQAPGFFVKGSAGAPSIWQDIRLAPGEKLTLHAIVAVSPAMDALIPTISALYTHTPLGWINITASFWKTRLGALRVDGPGAEKSAEFVERCVIDNFNCVQMDEQGRFVAHWQGAPSQVSARFWGIDAEFTAYSLLYAMPELGPAYIRYTADRCAPRYTPYPEHSTPIRMAPLLIASQYYALTGDLEFFRKDGETLKKLREIADALKSLLHPDGLMPSRYSSDGHVHRRYDHGTNAKAFRAFSGWASILEALSEDGATYRFIAERIRSQILRRMVAEGPFGPQITGGTNLNEDSDFYLAESLFYYDGEDSSSSLAPLYGVYGFEEPAWQNYHRYARSLFCPFYDPELRSLRWTPYRGMMDGSALVSALGGSVAREEMRRAFQDMLDIGCDETGSLFWWPLGKNCARGLTRCSQGQGAWVYQHMEQWLGLRMDAAARKLTLKPRGLYGAYRWDGARIGAFCFDIEWKETLEGAFARIANRNGVPFTVEYMQRARGVGLGAGFERATFTLSPDETRTVETGYPPDEREPRVDIEDAENRAFAGAGPVVGPCGIVLGSLLPFDESPVHILNLAVLAGSEPLFAVEVTLSVPEGFSVKAKRPGLIDPWRAEEMRQDVHLIGNLDARKRAVAPFYLLAPEEIAQSDEAPWLSGSPFAALPAEEPMAIWLCGETDQMPGDCDIALTAKNAKGERVGRRVRLPILSFSPETFLERTRKLLGGYNQAQIDGM